MKALLKTSPLPWKMGYNHNRRGTRDNLVFINGGKEVVAKLDGDHAFGNAQLILKAMKFVRADECSYETMVEKLAFDMACFEFSKKWATVYFKTSVTKNGFINRARACLASLGIRPAKRKKRAGVLPEEMREGNKP